MPLCLICQFPVLPPAAEVASYADIGNRRAVRRGRLRSGGRGRSIAPRCAGCPAAVTGEGVSRAHARAGGLDRLLRHVRVVCPVRYGGVVHRLLIRLLRGTRLRAARRSAAFAYIVIFLILL